MFLTRLFVGFRKLGGRYPEDGFPGLHSRDMFRRVLERERARADRTGGIDQFVILEIAEVGLLYGLVGEALPLDEFPFRAPLDEAVDCAIE